MDFKNYFDIPKDITYLNTPGNGLMPRTHYQWRQDRDKKFFDVNGHLRDQQGAFISSIKEEFASIFGCQQENLFALPNFSFGLHTILNGLPQNLKYAILEGDYPSLNYPIISRQLNYVKIRLDEFVEENIQKSILDNSVDVVLLSIVQYINGIKIDLDFIKRLKSANPNLIIIGDATQYLGTEPFDFYSSGFDIVGGSGYKWLMAGFGNGYMMISEYVKSMLYSKAQYGDRPREAMWSAKSILDTFFEPGHQDTLSHGTLLQSIRFLKEMGLDNISKYLVDLNDYAYSKLDERGLILPEISKRKIKSSLINLQIEPKHYEFLMENGIKCFPRGSGIRIGLHMYNTNEDVDKLIEVIDKIDK
ncbi:aminotransferase class V-fold PLP-dependent enzyme [Sphingobacterium bovistauri]|uniref:Aminotransferase class V-fold PLP-dependent enzyme n=1 Tax=Sphingobacterium bovistauri TaxID=2781959 RepID=A0ABS7Z713_9SPHI|nr:aminotransferase class V-fold PLP-dependent enzyme [Sphingobacterium bovistauri]MCA5005953.1 aminotransferase class V-fold PLP-dependent enzyme [Sphingobacterium bovistauri]